MCVMTLRRSDGVRWRNADHDLGTDLLVQARDERRFDRGLIVGVQVKGRAEPLQEAQTR